MANIKRNRATEIADALAFINETNMGGMAGESEMLQLIEEYFVDPETPDDEIESYDELDLEEDNTGNHRDQEMEATSQEPEPDADIPMEIGDESDSDHGDGIEEHDDDANNIQTGDDEEPHDEEVSAVIIQPVQANGEGDLPQEHQHVINAAHQPESMEQQLELARNFSCTCKMFDGEPCYNRYTPEYFVETRDPMTEMGKCRIL